MSSIPKEVNSKVTENISDKEESKESREDFYERLKGYTNQVP